jgi:hypothetical protein
VITHHACCCCCLIAVKLFRFFALKQAIKKNDTSKNLSALNTIYQKLNVTTDAATKPIHQGAPGSESKKSKRKRWYNRQPSAIQNSTAVDATWFNLLVARYWQSMNETSKFNALVKEKIDKKLKKLKLPTFLVIITFLILNAIDCHLRKCLIVRKRFAFDG